MKILHINTFDNGGAAKAVWRLHEALLNEGVDSQILVLYQENQPRDNVFNFNETQQSVWQKARLSLAYRWDVYQKQQLIQHKPKNYEIFSFPKSIYDLANHPLVKAADIIHLHWVAGFIDYPSFFRRINKPVIWTLHDMNPFSGGFHYDQDLTNNWHEYQQIDRQLRQTKIRALANIEHLSVTTPSQWLFEQSQNSEALGSFPHYLIPHSLNLDIFKKIDKKFARRVLNLPLNQPIVLFIADSNQNKRKGFVYLKEALSSIKYRQFGLAIAGKGKVERMPFRTHKLDFIFDDRLLSTAYSAADICVVPSLEDNLPNTVLEAMACGTPVIGSNVGGIPDMVRHEHTGLLFEPKNVKDLADKIAYLLVEEELRLLYGANARQVVEQEYNQLLQARRFKQLYQAIFQNPSQVHFKFNTALTTT
ncbi:MAG: glycosyltransferase [Microscillaceae bacterium]|jgi:glycosyltransferase involved in cell wall biosynthesis|nr:glycosyltransferase [Microscillaceae bacterium]